MNTTIDQNSSPGYGLPLLLTVQVCGKATEVLGQICPSAIQTKHRHDKLTLCILVPRECEVYEPTVSTVWALHSF